MTEKGLLLVSIKGNEYCSGDHFVKDVFTLLKDYDGTVLIADEIQVFNEFDSYHDMEAAYARVVHDREIWWSKNSGVFFEILKAHSIPYNFERDFYGNSVEEQINTLNKLLEISKVKLKVTLWRDWINESNKQNIINKFKQYYKEHPTYAESFVEGAKRYAKSNTGKWKEKFKNYEPGQLAHILFNVLAKFVEATTLTSNPEELLQLTHKCVSEIEKQLSTVNNSQIPSFQSILESQPLLSDNNDVGNICQQAFTTWIHVVSQRQDIREILIEKSLLYSAQIYLMAESPFISLYTLTSGIETYFYPGDEIPSVKKGRELMAPIDKINFINTKNEKGNKIEKPEKTLTDAISEILECEICDEAKMQALAGSILQAIKAAAPVPSVQGWVLSTLTSQFRELNFDSDENLQVKRPKNSSNNNIDNKTNSSPESSKKRKNPDNEPDKSMADLIKLLGVGQGIRREQSLDEDSFHNYEKIQNLRTVRTIPSDDVVSLYSTYPSLWSVPSPETVAKKSESTKNLNRKEFDQFNRKIAKAKDAIHTAICQIFQNLYVNMKSTSFVRRRLTKHTEVTSTLKKVVPKNFKLGVATVGEKNFLDAVAQGLNQLPNIEIVTARKLQALFNPSNSGNIFQQSVLNENNNARQLEQLQNLTEICQTICELYEVSIQIIDVSESTNKFEQMLITETDVKKYESPTQELFSERRVIHVVRHNKEMVPLLNETLPNAHIEFSEEMVLEQKTLLDEMNCDDPLECLLDILKEVNYPLDKREDYMKGLGLTFAKAIVDKMRVESFTPPNKKRQDQSASTPRLPS